MAFPYDLKVARNTAEVIDRLMTVQVAESGGGSALVDVPINPILYNAARAAQGDEPLTYLAAKAILENVEPGGSAVLSCGLMISPFMREEVDGCFGIAGMARAIALGAKATPIIMTEPNNVKRMETVLRSVGLDPQPLELALLAPHKCAVLGMPLEVEEAKKFYEEVHEKAHPSVLMVSEKMAPTDIGVYRTGPGFDLTKISGKTKELVESFRAHGKVTIGVGDGGNEVGMGKIKDTVRKVFKGDSAAAVETDILIVAGTGNLGCYGVEAVLAAAWGLPEILHNNDVERRMELASIFAGLIDPSTGYCDGITDMMDPSVAEAMILLMQNIVSHRLSKSNTFKQERLGARKASREKNQEVIDYWTELLNR